MCVEGMVPGRLEVSSAALTAEYAAEIELLDFA
jgi:hypothetical protein